jgi:hypothetical protein
VGNIAHLGPSRIPAFGRIISRRTENALSTRRCVFPIGELKVAAALEGALFSLVAGWVLARFAPAGSEGSWFWLTLGVGVLGVSLLMLIPGLLLSLLREGGPNPVGPVFLGIWIAPCFHFSARWLETSVYAWMAWFPRIGLWAWCFTLVASFLAWVVLRAARLWRRRRGGPVEKAPGK